LKKEGGPVAQKNFVYPHPEPRTRPFSASAVTSHSPTARQLFSGWFTSMEEALGCNE
jgi:hypothetical protein